MKKIDRDVKTIISYIISKDRLYKLSKFQSN